MTLNCSISGTPKPSVQWYKDRNPVSGGSTTLFLREVKNEDTGRYTCKAKNIGGSDEADIYIAVHSKSLPILLHFDVQKSIPNLLSFSHFQALELPCSIVLLVFCPICGIVCKHLVAS